MRLFNGILLGAALIAGPFTTLLPVTASKAGAVKGRENALRDPAIFVDTDGRRYLLYSVAGETGIAIAGLR